VTAVRTWFLRDVLDVLDRELGSPVLGRLPERLPPRLRDYVVLETLRSSSPVDTIPIADAEELLLGIDGALGDGSGKVLEGAMIELASRLLSQSGGLLVSDLMGTVARLRTTLERPFVEIDVMYELKKTDTGFSLTVGLQGRPRAARILRHLATGTIRAAHRFCREAIDEELRIYGETLGDRATLDARYRQPVVPASAPPDPTPFSRRTSRAVRAMQPTLSDEVERILSRAPSGEFASPLSTRVRTTTEAPPPPREGSEPDADED
jgi:hypothetical protein